MLTFVIAVRKTTPGLSLCISIVLIFLLATQAIAENSNSGGIHYFKVDEGSHIVIETADAVCGTLMGGIIDKSINLVCHSGSCSAKYTMASDYTKRLVYLTPLLDALFETEQQSDKPEVKQVHIPFIDKSDAEVTISLSSIITENTKEQIAKQAECFRRVGKVLIDKLKPYDKDSVLASISTSPNDTYKKAVYELPYIDQGVLYVSTPKDIRRGKPFILEATLVTSQKMGVLNPPPSMDHQIEMAKDAFGDALRLIGRPYRQGFEQLIRERQDASVEVYQQDALPLSGIDSSYDAAVAELTAGDVTISAVGTNKKLIKPLQAEFWSWIITANKSEDITAYLSVVASGAANAEAMKVIPITFHVYPDWFTQGRDFIFDHIEWIVGSALIPLAVYIWGKWFKRKRKQSTSGHPKPLQPHGRR